MKLLFDQNLSFRLCERLSDLFPDSNQVRLASLEAADDRAIWEFAKASGFAIGSQDSDFADMAALFGPPPKVIWLRCGNQPNEVIKKYSATVPARSAYLNKTLAQRVGSFIELW